MAEFRRVSRVLSRAWPCVIAYPAGSSWPLRVWHPIPPHPPGRPQYQDKKFVAQIHGMKPALLEQPHAPRFRGLPPRFEIRPLTAVNAHGGHHLQRPERPRGSGSPSIEQYQVHRQGRELTGFQNLFRGSAIQQVRAGTGSCERQRMERASGWRRAYPRPHEHTFVGQALVEFQQAGAGGPPLGPIEQGRNVRGKTNVVLKDQGGRSIRIEEEL